MSLKRMLILLPASFFLLGSVPSFAQSVPGPDGGIPGGVPGGVPGDVPVDPAPVETAPSVEPEMTPESSIEPESSVESDTPSNIGGTSPDGPLSLVQCGPSSAAFVVTKVPVGCHVLGVNSPPGQAENAETPE